MTHKNKNGTPRPAELFRHMQERETVSDAYTVPARAEEMFARRKEALSRIQPEIGERLYHVLCEKVEYEHTLLLQMLETTAKALEAKKKANKVLDASYFVRKPLDTKHFLTL